MSNISYEMIKVLIEDQMSTVGLLEVANTVAADVNEIMLGYHCGMVGSATRVKHLK